MSWSANRTTIVSGLPSGYVNLPLNQDPDLEDLPISHNHLGYSLKLKGIIDGDVLSSNVYHYSHLVEMKAIYKGVDGTQLITNEGLAMTLVQTISGISGFHNFAEEPVIEALDTKHIVLTLVFHFGQDDNE
jgi:hypothetical protein